MELPLLVGCSDLGQTELRGSLKNVYYTHEYGARYMTPVGDSLDAMKMTNIMYQWNGSKQYRVFY